jgi:hypothetical protein
LLNNEFNGFNPCTAFLIIPIAYTNKRFAMFLKQFLRPLLPGLQFQPCYQFNTSGTIS